MSSPQPATTPNRLGLTRTSREAKGETKTLGIHKDSELSFKSEEEAMAFALATAAQAAERVKHTEWAQWVGREFARCRTLRQPFERQWYLNLAFYSGRQYVSPIIAPGVGFRLTTPPSPRHRVRLVNNKIRPAIRNETAKLASSKPIPTVVPATTEDEDYAAANVAEAILKGSFNTNQYHGTYRSWIWWGAICGNSYKKQYWDPTAKDYDNMQLPQPPLNPMTGAPADQTMMNAIFQQHPELKKSYETPRPAVGKIVRDVVTPFHLYVPDLLSEDLNDQPYIIHAMAKTPLWVKNKYPQFWPGESLPVCDSISDSSMLDSISIITKGHTQEQLNAVKVMEVWIKPNGHADFPTGGVVTVINNRVVQAVAEWPLDYPEYPFYPYFGIPTGGFYRDSVIVDLIPIQKEYNKKRSQSIEITNMMGKPKFTYQQGSIDIRKVNTETGQGIPYKPGYEAPTIIPGAEVPSSFVNEIETLRQEFDDISGQHEISRGTTPPDVKSGTAIAFLQEQDDSKLHYQVASIEDATELMGTHFLKLAAKYWDDGRVVKVAGTNYAFESFAWKKNALRGNTDVRVQTGSALPYSKAARTAQVQEMMMNGQIPVDQGMEMLQIPGFEKTLDELLVDKRQAQRENLKMAQAPDELLNLMLNPAPGPEGEPPPPPFPNPKNPNQQIQLNWDGSLFQAQPPIPVNSWDNHEEHVRWHDNYRKTQQFEILSENQKKAFELHVQLHKQALMSQIVNVQGAVIEDNSGAPALSPGEDGPPGEEQAPGGEDTGGGPPPAG